jgi:hypothetical protein
VPFKGLYLVEQMLDPLDPLSMALSGRFAQSMHGGIQLCKVTALPRVDHQEQQLFDLAGTAAGLHVAVGERGWLWQIVC